MECCSTVLTIKVSYKGRKKKKELGGNVLSRGVLIKRSTCYISYFAEQDLAKCTLGLQT